MTQRKLGTSDGIGHISSFAATCQPSRGSKSWCRTPMSGLQNLYPLIYLLADASPPGPPYHRGQLGSEGDGA